MGKGQVQVSRPVSGKSSGNGKEVRRRGFQRNTRGEGMQSLEICRMGDGWDIRDWTLLDFIMYLAAPVHRQVQLEENTNIQLSHEKYRCVIAMVGRKKTKGALLMESRARKTKSTSWLDFVFSLMKWKRKCPTGTGVTTPKLDSGSPVRMSLCF